MKTLPAKVTHPPLLLVSIAILLGVAACDGSGPERRTEKRDEATHVFTGTVKAVHSERVEPVVFYEVDVTVEAVEKGEGLKPGDTATVNCYIRMPDLRVPVPPKKKILEIGPPTGSYSSVPKKNERIKVYARKLKETYEGIYPDWYDVLKAD